MKELSLITKEPTTEKRIEDCIITIRDKQVMLDSDVAFFFGVETKQLNQQMKRNLDRLPEDFCFQLTNIESKQILRSQNVTSNYLSSRRRYNPYVFTEHGIIALAGVIKNDIAAKMSVEIVRQFVAMRKFIVENSDILLSIAKIQNRQLEFENETNIKFDKVLKKIEKLDIPQTVLIYDGQYYKAQDFIINLIKKAEKKITLIDSYCDSKALSFLSSKNEEVIVYIYKSEQSKLKDEEIELFEMEYGKVIVKTINTIHDRYLIIDDNECYSLGASLNYAGKKLFTINRIEIESVIESLITYISSSKL